MTDRELLEAAAKAAGWKAWRSKHGYWNVESPDGKAHTCCNGWASYSDTNGDKLPDATFGDALAEVGWHPFDDDGDALRLSVKLGMAVSVEFNFASTAVLWGPPTGNVREPHGDAIHRN